MAGVNLDLDKSTHLYGHIDFADSKEFSEVTIPTVDMGRGKIGKAVDKAFKHKIALIAVFVLAAFATTIVVLALTHPHVFSFATPKGGSGVNPKAGLGDSYA